MLIIRKVCSSTSIRANSSWNSLPAFFKRSRIKSRDEKNQKKKKKDRKTIDSKGNPFFFCCLPAWRSIWSKDLLWRNLVSFGPRYRPFMFNFRLIFCFPKSKLCGHRLPESILQWYGISFQVSHSAGNHWAKRFTSVRMAGWRLGPIFGSIRSPHRCSRLDWIDERQTRLT